MSTGSEPLLTEERKVVTVLFCDLVDFTASSDTADPEDVRARLRPYHARVRDEIEGYGGTVEKFIGDAVMAVYGAPVVHEDDAERAVRSALRIIEAIGDLNDAHPGLDLEVRIGIATGEAVVTLGARPEQGEAMVAGDVVNTAARLQGAAPVGGVAVGEQTHAATTALFDYEVLEPVVLKGKAQPVRIWRPLAARSRMGVDVVRAHATPLVGRELERQLVVGGFERVLRDRQPQLVTIVGEPGVGKSRLVSELFAHIDGLPDLVRWRQGRCLPYGEGITFWALGEIVKGELGILESDPPTTAAEKLDAAIPEGPDRDWLCQRLAPLVGLEATSSAERDELFTAWRRFLEALAADSPSVFVFEDLHWADEAMLAFLEHLADWAEGVPMLLVTTTRPELFERHPTWAAAARNATRINLGPLTETETGELISMLLEQSVLPADVQGLLLERAGGNPLYAEEFVRLLRDRGFLLGDTRIVALAEGAEIPFPESVQALIGARLDTLAPARKAILQDAAVIGKVFWAGAVAAMGGLERRAVIEALHGLSRKELVRPARVSSMAGEDEYAFWHILVRDVAYAQIPRAKRADRHRQAAAWIATMAGDRVEDEAEILAHHYTTALELARSAGEADVAGLEEAALRFLVLAGERALALDVARAEEHLQRALSFAPPGHAQRAAILVRWGETVRAANRHAEATAALEEAVSLFRDQGDTAASASALTMLANVRWQVGDPRSPTLAAEAVTLLETLPPGRELVDAYAEVSRQQHLSGQYRESVASGERALELARALGLGEPAKPLGYVGASRLTLGGEAGLEEMRRSVALATEAGQAREAAILTNNLADATASIEGPAASLSLYRQGIDYCDRRGITEIALWMSTEAAGQMVRAGLLDEALASAERVAARFEADADVVGLVRSRCVQSIVLAYRGRAGEALPIIDWATSAAETGKAIESLILARQIGAVIHLAVGDGDGAAERIRLLLEDRLAIDSWTHVFHFPDSVRTAAGAGDLALAERLASLPTLSPDHQHGHVTARAVIAEAKGAFDDAAAGYAEAAARWQGFGVVTERAFALLGQGRCLVALGRPEQAADALRSAAGLFTAMGMEPGLTEANALLERTAAVAS